jgi:hypothetical protein
VSGWEHIVTIPQVVLAELPRYVSRVLCSKVAIVGSSFSSLQRLEGRPWSTPFGSVIGRDEGRTACGTALLPVPIRKECTFFGNTIDIGVL